MGRCYLMGFLMLLILIMTVGCAADANVQSQENTGDLRLENQNLKAQLQLAEQRLSTLERSKPGKIASADNKRQSEVVITLSSEELFSPGSVRLTKKGEKELDAVVKRIKKEFPNASLRIEGHTDDSPIQHTKKQFKSNWELSGARALAVLHYFIEQGKMDPKRLSYAGYGQYDPIDPKNKQKNRRVEIVIIQP